MNFKIIKLLFIALMLPILFSCSDPENETPLVNQIRVASQDIIAINFPADTETILSVDSEYSFKLEGLKSNGLDKVNINQNIIWSLSTGANSTINQDGKLSAAGTAENITVTAQFGYLTTSIDIRISAAKFDQVIALHEADISIEMCQTQNIIPIGRYIDASGNEEIRPVDSTIINSIEWNALDSQSNPSQSAFIKTLNTQTSLTALAAGDIKITATALSLFSGNETTSEAFDLSIGNHLSLLKICNASASDLSTCSLNTIDIEQNNSLAIMAVGRYLNTDGSNQDINITAATKWGLTDSSVLSLQLSSDQQQLNITGNIADNSTSLSFACGDIEQNIQSLDVSQGIVLDEAISCAPGDLNCLQGTAIINVNALQISSLEVKVNGTAISHNQLFSLSSRPADITLQVNGNFADNSSRDLSNDGDLTYQLIATQPAVVEAVSGSPGVYRVLTAGTAEIQIQYQSSVFIALIRIP